MHIVKDKVPKGESFVLKPSILEQMIHEAGFSAQIDLHQTHSDILFDAFFWPASPNVSYERFLVRAGTVPSDQARAARNHMESMVLPEFTAWAASLLQLPQNSTVRLSKQEFSRELPGHT